jgi:CRISPR-associated protein Cmr6
MPNSSDTANKVPLMFRAQVEGRCQIQRLVPKAPEQYATRWADEWVIEAYPNAPDFGDDAQTKIYELSWRFVTNSGQDDGVIRPVIGARGWPYYPGSSMKGLFRQAAQRMEQLGELKEGTCDRYCGIESKQGPGILRFHGGYPTDTRWTENLVDIVHPQQDQQVKSDSRSSSAFIQISLYKPELKFGISSTEPLDEAEWEQIWTIWETALSMGLGCRVSAGYGQPENHIGEILYRARLKGQGQAAKLIDGTGEFRPNIFRAAIRGHALRIFGGLTDADTAEHISSELIRRHYRWRHRWSGQHGLSRYSPGIGRIWPGFLRSTYL